MALKLNVGVSRKLGLPGFSSAGASCHVEVELDAGLLHDRDAFHTQVRAAFLATQEAVHDELARLQGQPVPVPPVRTAAAGPLDPRHGSATSGDVTAAGSGRASPRPTARHRLRPATARQVEAIHAAAGAQDRDLGELLADHGVARPEELSVSQASALISHLRAVSR